MEFIGRNQELRALLEQYTSGRSSFVPIYGRRRVGKSELIVRFMRGRPGIYHVGKRVPAGLQIKGFLEVAAVALNEPWLAQLSGVGWRDALTAVSDRWQRPEPMVLALDEFQWMVEASPELPSVLQELWDRRWKPSESVFLVLCGSYVGFMEREVLGKKSPLFGRRTAQIQLRPFGYREAALFHPAYSTLDAARAYFVCGGVPAYLEHFAEDRSIEVNIRRAILREFGPLFREADFLLREELRDVERYYAVLTALAHGSATASEISRQTEIDNRSLDYYVRQLSELGYVARKYPLTERSPVRRHVRYELADPLLRFWFRFVLPNLSFLAHLGPERVFVERVRPQLDAWWGGCFERLCREALSDLYYREGVSASFDVGEYWDPRTQIDLVGLRSDGWTDLGECRFGRVRSLSRLIAELDEKVARYPNHRNATIGRRVFTRHRVQDGRRLPGVRFHCLDDLYAE